MSYGRLHRLEVIGRSGSLEFNLGDQVFAALTASAKHICSDETRTISGPQFWRAPLALGASDQAWIPTPDGAPRAPVDAINPTGRR